ncbi:MULTISPECIES: HEAT repeat domain-containing protein [Paenibacillus]|uniref:HEAT repeat domain-containing protein n=1 Tax=Paenibacillus TaxID=44249 RepID=UPI0015765C5F|nr:HEAT repeat domain-containing protein [Paenibacillus sp. JMULE4]NTZ17472.1 HEAT repeat domain-containing protein [Paenibacillus sp. JMULE4]
MSQFGDLGRQHLQAESYGAAAFCFYRAIVENQENGNAWNGLVLALSLMRKEYDVQTILARFAMQQGVAYDKDMISFALMMWRQSPGAMAEWLRRMLTRGGLSAEEKQALTQMAEELEQSYRDLVERYGEELLKRQGILSLSEYADRRIELDWLMAEPLDNVFEQVKVWLEQDAESVLTAVRLLCMVPDPRSEKLLRRVCRNEEIDPKARTHALLALRWLGVRGNVKLNKFEESFVINLDDPKPELTVSVPEAYKPALDRMKLWIAMKKGFVTPEQYERHASTDEKELPAELAAKVEEADIPGVLQEVVHTLIRAAYDKYYPLVPTIKGTRQWSAAFLMLMKDYVEGIGEEWPYGEPERDETAVGHRNWLLSGSPDYYDSIKAAGRLRAGQAG